jgi:hypothetical protein
MTATLTPSAKQQFFDANGNPLVGGKLYTYSAGTTSPVVTYVDSVGTTTNTNPIILDSRGEANVWLGTGTFKFKLLSATDVEIWTVDNIPGAHLTTVIPTGYGTPTGNVNQGSFNATSITLPNLAAEVAQLVIDLKTAGVIAA